MDAMWLAVLAMMGLWVRVGQALQATGMSRSKNAAGALARAVADICAAVLAYWILGAALLHQDNNNILGFETTWWAGVAHAQNAPIWLMHLAMILIGTGLVSAVLSERSRFRVTMVVAFVLAGILLPIVRQWAWTGWLRAMGFVDVAGAAVIHVAVGLFAAAGAKVIGPRTGKYNRDGSSNMIPGHNVPLAAAGMLAMLIAWPAYVTAASMAHDGSAHLAPMHVLLAAAGAGLAAFVYSVWRFGKADLLLCFAGILGGVVAITSCAGMIPSAGAVVIGVVAGILVPMLSVSIDLQLKLDDPSGAVAVHVVGGAWGTLAAAFFLPGDAGERFKQLGVQALGLAVVASASIVISLILFSVMKATIGVRSREADEYDGLDLAEHDLNAYPDFQQTMIKSYHLREA